jgi:hypothetical protein
MKFHVWVELYNRKRIHTIIYSMEAVCLDFFSDLLIQVWQYAYYYIDVHEKLRFPSEIKTIISPSELKTFILRWYNKKKVPLFIIILLPKTTAIQSGELLCSCYFWFFFCYSEGHIWDKEKVALYDRWPQKRFKAYEIFNDMTRKWWTFNTDDFLMPF